MSANFAKTLVWKHEYDVKSSVQPWGGAFGHLPPSQIFKTLHSNIDICRNFQRI